MTRGSVKIRTLTAPQTDLSSFDPGVYLGGLDFYETADPISDEDRDGLAQFAHFLAFLALQAESSEWQHSVVSRNTLAFRALESHFEDLEGWNELVEGAEGIPYRALVTFLMQHYPPHAPKH